MLVVDDEEAVLFAMHDYFESLGYEVDCAADLVTTKALLREVSYAFVITDLRLGGRDNEEGLQIVRCAHKRNPHARIVLLTAYGSLAFAMEARRLGADTALNKPISLSALAQLMRTNAQ